MKKYLSLLLMIPLTGLAQTGRTIQGPSTLGQPSYPNSGQLRNRSNDITGEDMANSTFMGSDVNPSVPGRNTISGSNREETQTGPYRDRYRFHEESGLRGIEAQEAAENDEFDLTEEEIQRKQQGN